MRKFLFPVSLVALVFIVTAALAEPVALERLAKFFQGGFYVGALATASSNNKVTKIRASGDITYDCADTATQVCTDSSGTTLTGAAVGDTCEIGPNATAAALNGTWTCYVSAANTVKIKFCNVTVGSINPASGAFRVRTLSNQ